MVIFSIMHFLGYYLPSDNFCYFASCTIILRVVLLFCELYYYFASCTIILRVVQRDIKNVVVQIPGKSKDLPRESNHQRILQPGCARTALGALHFAVNLDY